MYDFKDDSFIKLDEEVKVGDARWVEGFAESAVGSSSLGLKVATSKVVGYDDSILLLDGAKII